MPLSIKDSKTDRLAREVAMATGETITVAVTRALEERLQRLAVRTKGYSLSDELIEIGQRCAALPRLDSRTADEILGYDENGVPS